MSFSQLALTGWQKFLLFALRFLVGWHLFYQGFGKITDPHWTARGYLELSWGPFLWLVQSPALLPVADVIMSWGLLISGVLLMIGLFTRPAALGALGLLLMIFLALPPLDYTGFVVSTRDGSELWVNKTLIETVALLVIASFNTGKIFGLDLLFSPR